MLVLGAIVLVAGLIGAGALWYASAQRLDDNVAGFARAPSGCSTTLDVERTGEFRLYAETKGSLDGLAGDCSASTDYDRDEIANPQLTIVGPDGSAIDISDTGDVSYDAGGFSGAAVGAVQIDATGTYVLTVIADGAQFAIAVGGDPNDGVALLRWGAVGLAIVALVLGGLLLVLGSRRPPSESITPTPTWEPGGPTATWPIGPPGFPAPPPTTGATAPAGPPVVTPAGVATPGSGWGPPSISSGA